LAGAVPPQQAAAGQVPDAGVGGPGGLNYNGARAQFPFMFQPAGGAPPPFMFRPPGPRPGDAAGAGSPNPNPASYPFSIPPMPYIPLGQFNILIFKST
jgi:hypothetical protein